MPATLTASIVGLIEGTVDIGTVQHALSYGPTLNLGDGTGAGQIDRIFADTRTLAASASEDLDLAGVLVDAIGRVVTFARVRGLLVRSAPGNTNNITVGGAASNGWVTAFGAATHTLTVRPGGFVMLGAPDATAYGVTAGTGDLLRIANAAGGSPVSYDIVILGSTA